MYLKDANKAIGFQIEEHIGFNVGDDISVAKVTVMYLLRDRRNATDKLYEAVLHRNMNL